MRNRYYTLLLFTLTLVLVSIPTLLFAQENKYHPLVGVPGVPSNPTDIEQYINALYVLSIGLASMLAVVKIIMAGVQYMLTDVVTAKGEAKKDIMGALLGLVLILGAVTILNTINPNLTTFNIFDDSRQLSVPTGGDAGCPIGQKWVACWEGSGGQGQQTKAGCYAPSDTSWCDGEIYTPDPEPESQNTSDASTETWIETITVPAGLTAAAVGGELSDTCRAGGGSPEVESLSNGTKVRIVCVHE